MSMEDAQAKMRFLFGTLSCRSAGGVMTFRSGSPSRSGRVGGSSVTIFRPHLTFMSPMRQNPESPNNSPEPIAVGAVRSAVAVHVTSRRWLSFFRSVAQCRGIHACSVQ